VNGIFPEYPFMLRVPKAHWEMVIAELTKRNIVYRVKRNPTSESPVGLIDLPLSTNLLAVMGIVGKTQPKPFGGRR
jgi:hypothetical protein